MPMIRFPDPVSVASRATDLLADHLARTPDARVLLPAGGTPIPLYEEMRRRVERGDLDVSRAHLFQLDELVGVPPTDARSFHGFLRTHLLDRIPRDRAADHLLAGDTADPRAEIAGHAAALERLGGADLVLLGLGPNGHVAYNEPGSTADDGARVVELQTTTLAGLADAFGADHPRLGMTLGLRELLAGREVVLLVTGRAKRPALERLLATRDDPDFPASFLNTHPAFTVLADTAACGEPA